MRNPLFLILVSAFGGVFGVDTGDVKMMSVMEGDSVTLNTCVNDIQKYSNVVWTYGPSKFVLAKSSQTSIYDDALDEMFRGRLKLDPQTGSLSIKNIRTSHAGLYTAEITSRDPAEGSSERAFNVTVTGVFDPEADKLKSVLKNEGEPVTLDTGVVVKRDDLIVWKYGRSSKHCVYDAVHNTPAIAKLYGDAREMPGGMLVDAGEDQMFSGRLSLNKQTGDLTIRNTKTKHAGCYFLQINSNAGTRFRRFNLTVTATREPGLQTHWEITGPLFLGAAIVLGVIVIWLLSKRNRHCRKYPDSETTQESVNLNPNNSVNEQRI